MQRSFSLWILCVLLLSLTLSSCESDWLMLPTETPMEPTATITETPIPTETRIWFPPTETNTPHPNTIERTATPDLRPLENDIILTDTFTESSNWEQFSNTLMSASYGVNELTLALKGEKGTLYSFNSQLMPNDYYLELLIEPSLCTGEDQFGVLFRTQSKQEFYRIIMSCEGQIRLDQVKGSSAVQLDESRLAPQIFNTPGGRIQLNIWLTGDGVKIFINEVLQLEYYRLQWYAGDIGVFARSTGENALTVSFSDLVLRYTNQLPVTPTPTITETPD